MRQRLVSLLLMVLFARCAGPQRAAESNLRSPSPPPLSVRLFASSTPQQLPRELHSGDAVRSGEQVELHVVAQRPAHIYVVLYAPAGESGLLYGGVTSIATAAEKLLRVAVPRVAQPGQAPLPELRLFVLASETPLDPALCPLLRLRCPLERPPGGSRDDGKKQEKSKSENGKSTGSKSAQSEEGKIVRGEDCAAVTLGEASAGLHAPVTLFPVVLKFE